MSLITSQNVHAWQGQAHFLCDIPNHGLTYFKDIDKAINWLYFNGFKESARELNTYKKESINARNI